MPFLPCGWRSLTSRAREQKTCHKRQFSLGNAKKLPTRQWVFNDLPDFERRRSVLRRFGADDKLCGEVLMWRKVHSGNETQVERFAPEGGAIRSRVTRTEPPPLEGTNWGRHGSCRENRSGKAGLACRAWHPVHDGQPRGQSPCARSYFRRAFRCDHRGPIPGGRSARSRQASAQSAPHSCREPAQSLPRGAILRICSAANF